MGIMGVIYTSRDHLTLSLALPMAAPMAVSMAVPMAASMIVSMAAPIRVRKIGSDIGGYLDQIRWALYSCGFQGETSDISRYQNYQ